MAFCTKCGQVLKEGTMFCISCGQPVPSTMKPTAEPSASAEPAVAEQPMAQQPMAQQPSAQPMPQQMPPMQQPAPAPAPVPAFAQVPPMPQPMEQPPMPQPMEQQSVSQPMEQQPMPQPKAQEKPGKKTPLGLILGLAGGGAVILAGIAVALYFLVFKPVTIDLDPFISIETSGYDSKGKAVAKFDYDGFEMTYGDKLRKKNRKIPDPSVKFTHEVINYSLSKSDNLSNGDDIQLTWHNDEVLAKSMKCKIVCNDLTTVVSGLEEVEFVDPFQWVSVSISGTAPRAYAKYTIDSSSELLSHITYRFTNDENLKYGETISLLVESDLTEDQMMEQYGVVLEPREQSYTINQVSRYAQCINDLPDESVDAINAYIMEKTAEIFDEGDLVNMECLGLYMYTLSNQSPADDFNRVYFVYEITVKQKKKLPDFTFYTVFCLSDVIIDANGKDNMDVNDLDNFGVYDETPDGYYYYWGYNTFEFLYEDIVDRMPGNYYLDKTVTKQPKLDDEDEEDETI